MYRFDTHAPCGKGSSSQARRLSGSGGVWAGLITGRDKGRTERLRDAHLPELKIDNGPHDMDLPVDDRGQVVQPVWIIPPPMDSQGVVEWMESLALKMQDRTGERGSPSYGLALDKTRIRILPA